MIVINSNMLPGDSPRLNLVTSSRDYLATVDYPLRPTVHRTWGKPHRPRSKWHCCYFPQSFPVYRMQRMISMILCLLVMVMLSVVAFVLVQVVPPQQMFKNKSAPHGDIIENGFSNDEDYRKRESGLGLVRTARKLEDHAEYKRSTNDDYSDDYEDDYAEDNDDELILNSYGDNGYDDEQDYNPVFDMKYFDFSQKTKENEIIQGETADNLDKNNDRTSFPIFTTPNIREKWEKLPQVKIENDFQMNIIVDGIVFSQTVEALLREPEVSDAKIGQIQGQLRASKVTSLQEPTWERCGRPKNQWLEMSSGGAACARYRYPDDYLLVGEVLSFYLSRVLSVGHVPPVVLSQPTGTLWQPVQEDMGRAGWGEAPVVVLTPWLPSLVRDHMPSILLNAVMRNATLSATAEDEEGNGAIQAAPYIKESKQTNEEKGFKEHNRESVKKGDADSPSSSHQQKEEKEAAAKSNRLLVGTRNIKELSERDWTKLLQWSDLLVFDYLTGNYDRVAYMQDAAEKEGRLRVLSGTIHNLVRSKTTDALWLLDNESGLIDAYTLLYSTADPVQSNRFHLFHKQMLESICIFRRSTMEAILGLYNHPKPHVLLVDFVRRHEPLFHLLPDPLQNTLFVKYFPVRVKEVYDWISQCITKVQEHSRTR